MGYRILLPGILLVCLAAVAGSCREVAQTVLPYKSDSLTIGAGQVYSETVRLDSGGHIEGDITVRDNDIRFYVKDPQDKVVFDAGRFSGQKNFYIEAEGDGYYTWYLDNTYSLFTSKLVFIHWRAIQ
jgi:hypothetical protein